MCVGERKREEEGEGKCKKTLKKQLLLDALQLLSCPVQQQQQLLLSSSLERERADTDGPGYVPGTVNGFGPLSRHVYYEI